MTHYIKLELGFLEDGADKKPTTIGGMTVTFKTSEEMWANYDKIHDLLLPECPSEEEAKK